MTNWPDKPLIRIIKGKVEGKPISEKIAVRTEGGHYTIGNHICLEDYSRDRINAWEEVTAVPTAALKHLRDVFLGVELPLTQFAAIQQVVSHLSADKPSALDRAVTRVKDTGGPMISGGDSNENRLSLLLDALASITIATNKAAPLVTVARICVDWANTEEPHCDALREIEGRAKSDPTRFDFVGLASYVGDVAASLDDGTNGGPRNDLLEMGSHALAWAAQIIEEEEK